MFNKIIMAHLILLSSLSMYAANNQPITPITIGGFEYTQQSVEVSDLNDPHAPYTRKEITLFDQHNRRIGEMVCFVFHTKSYGKLSIIRVIPTFQKKGVGRYLFRQAVGFCAEQRKKYMCWFAISLDIPLRMDEEEVARIKEKLIEWYIKQGSTLIDAERKKMVYQLPLIEEAIPENRDNNEDLSEEKS